MKSILKAGLLLSLFCIIGTGAANPIFASESEGDPKITIEKATQFLLDKGESLNPLSYVILDYLERKFNTKLVSDVDSIQRRINEESEEGEYFRQFSRLTSKEAQFPVITEKTKEDRIELIGLNCMYCDQLGMGSNKLMAEVKQMSTEGDYELTHAMIFSQMANELGCFNQADYAQFVNENSRKLVGWISAQKHVDDIQIERIAALYYCGKRDLVKKEWIEDIMKAQQEDGSWGNNSTDPNEHTTVLAIWVMLEYANPNVQQINWIQKD